MSEALLSRSLLSITGKIKTDLSQGNLPVGVPDVNYVDLANSSAISKKVLDDQTITKDERLSVIDPFNFYDATRAMINTVYAQQSVIAELRCILSFQCRIYGYYGEKTNSRLFLHSDVSVKPTLTTGGTLLAWTPSVLTISAPYILTVTETKSAWNATAIPGKVEWAVAKHNGTTWDVAALRCNAADYMSVLRRIKYDPQFQLWTNILPANIASTIQLISFNGVTTRITAPHIYLADILEEKFVEMALIHSSYVKVV
jgi:hypothetical protein